MTEKIEWYKEILDLEPNSKVFFPLARLLKKENCNDEAMEILRKGLESHPEFLEARLFYVELLYKTGRQNDCASQIDKISNIFSNYTEFWQAWAACLSADGASQDISSVLRFVAASFVYTSLSLHEVFDKGINAVLGQNAPQPISQKISNCSDSETQISSSSARAGQVLGKPLITIAPKQIRDKKLVAPVRQPENRTKSEYSAHDTDTEQAATEGIEEHFSLRTRSMAEVLAEQGDFNGALDIYQELAAASIDAEERADLAQRIATLNVKLTAAPEEVTLPTVSDSDIATGKDKLISMLEALAERVEARASS